MKEHKKIGVVVLSRFNSTRLPGKALMPIHGKKVLTYIVERLQQVFPLEDIVIATSEEDSDLPIVDFAKGNNIPVFRGSLENVSRRFYEAALSKQWDYVVRINGDNVLVDTALLKTMSEIALKNELLFVSNVKDRTYPKGMSIEIVRVEHYAALLPAIEQSPSYREHVTLYLYEREQHASYQFVYNDRFPKLKGISLALDTKEDLDRITKIISHFDRPHYSCNMEEINGLIELIDNE